MQRCATYLWARAIPTGTKLHIFEIQEFSVELLCGSEHLTAEIHHKGHQGHEGANLFAARDAEKTRHFSRCFLLLRRVFRVLCGEFSYLFRVISEAEALIAFSICRSRLA
jgi:hypothetical protein